jgi:NADH dehydrogenase
MKHVLVLGGTGFLGHALCAQWADHSFGAGTRVTVATRRAAHGRDLLELPGLEVEECDVHDDASLARLLDGCDAVVNLVAILHGSPREFARVHVELPQRIARLCGAAGVRRVVHVSALGVGPGAPSHYLKTKTAGEAALRDAGLDLTVLRPSVMFGAGDRFLNMFARLEAALPVVPLAGARSRYQPVWVDDVARGILQCLERPETAGRVYECVGPDIYTLEQLVRLAGEWSGHARPVVALPEPLARLQAMVTEALPGQPLLSRDNLDSMRVDSVATGTLPTLQDLGLQPATLAAVAPLYLKPGTAMSDWLDGFRRRH